MSCKLFIQIPCFNEEKTLVSVLESIPKKISGVSEIKIVVVDDGSTDNTFEVAKANSVDFIEKNTGNLGLAFTFRRALSVCLREGADIIVNMDGDNQYRGSDIERLISPLIQGQADMVLGQRDIDSISEFSFTKKLLQKLGSFIVNKLSGLDVKDATTGFRALNRDAAFKLNILSNYTYTLESLLQARSKGIIVAGVDISTNPKTRDSRLMKSMWQYITFSAATIIRIFSMYNPLKLFLSVGGLSIFLGSLIAFRFLYFYFLGDGVGKIQSLIFAAILILQGIIIAFVGILADSIQFGRRLSEEALVRLKMIEYEQK